MKSMWFHLMPYPDLPERFPQENRSVWVDIDPTLYDPVRGHHMYQQYIGELEYAASVGLDAVCVNEHHSNAYGMMPSPNLVASILARNVPDATIAVMGNTLPLYNPATRVAEELAMLDAISGGRIIAGFPVGSAMDTCYAYGTNPATLRERYQEAHDLILKAWTAKEPFAFNGQYNKQRYVNVWPRPVQRPHPPIWIPGGGSIDTWEWCARMDYVYCYLSYYGYQAGEEGMRGYWKTVREHGRDDNPYRAAFAQFIGVAETDQEARELYAEPAEYFYHRCLHIHGGFAEPPGYKTEATLMAGVQGMMERAASGKPAAPGAGSKKQVHGMSFDQLVERGWVVVGSVATVTEKLMTAAKTLRFGNLFALLQFGNMSTEVCRYNTRMFATQVMPELRTLWSNEYEHRWWPKPLQDRSSATQRQAAE